MLTLPYIGCSKILQSQFSEMQRNCFFFPSEFDYPLLTVNALLDADGIAGVETVWYTNDGCG